MQRKARAGHVCGGAACFGYENVTIAGPDGRRSHVERRINEEQAAIVRRIFAESIAGHGYSRIARGLTADRAPCPRPQQGRPAAWGPSTVYEVLHRDLYRGIVIWNKTRKRDRWGQSRTIARPEAEWLRVERPELRIVSEEVWEAAHERLSRIRTRLETARGGRPIVRRDVVSQYLLSGFARCAQCGGTLSVLSRGNLERVYLYGCLANHKRGHMVCSNALTMPVKVVDDAVLKELGGDSLRPAVVKAIVAAVFDAMEPAAARANAEAMHADLRTLDRKIANLTAAIEDGAAAPPLVQQLAARQKEREELLAAIATAEANADLVLDRKTIERKVLDQVQTWRSLLTGSVADGPQLLREVLEEPLRFTPEGKAYRFEGRVATGRLIAGLVSPLHLVWRALGDSMPFGRSIARKFAQKSGASRSCAPARLGVAERAELLAARHESVCESRAKDPA